MANNKNSIDAKLAEERLIGSLIYKPDKIVEVIDKINPNIFSVKEFGQIYNCIIELYKNDIQPDDVTILNKACNLGYDIAPELVKKLSNNVTFVTKAQLKNYCEIIQTSAFKKKTLDLCTDFLEQAKDVNSPEKIINDFFELAINLSDKVKASNNTSQINIDKNSVLDDLDYRYNNPDIISGVPFGFPTIDKYMDGCEKGDIITIAGHNSHGKSYFSQVCCINQAIELLKNKSKEKVLFISLEMTREQMERRFRSILTGVDSKYFKNPKLYFIEKHIEDTPENFKKFKEVIAKSIDVLNTLPIVIDDSSELTATEIVAMIKKHILKYGLKSVWIDYVGLIASDADEDYKGIAKSYKILKKVAKSTGVPICVLTQYLKDFKGREKSANKGTMFDLAGGKSAMNDSMKILHVWKPDKFPDFIEKHPEYIGKIVVFSDKNRDGVYGDMPEIPLQFEHGQLKETKTIIKQTENVIEEVFSNAI